jgi:hypothetical protein
MLVSNINILIHISKGIVMAFYLAKVQFEITNEQGKVKKHNRTYVVDAVSVTDAEVMVNRYLKDSTEPFEVKTIAESKIVDCIYEK